MSLKRIILFTVFTITLFWLIVIVGGFHFYSVDIPTKIPWILILLFGCYKFLSTNQKSKRIEIGIVVPLVLLLYIPIMWWFGYGSIIGIQSDLKIIECTFCNKKIISYFHQGYWGGEPLETTAIGETYLGGLIYKTSIDTTYFAEYQYAEEVDSQIQLPVMVNPKDLVFVWKGQNILLVVKDNLTNCFPLTYKKY